MSEPTLHRRRPDPRFPAPPPPPPSAQSSAQPSAQSSAYPRYPLGPPLSAYGAQDLDEEAEPAETLTVTSRPCAEPHDFEAYHESDLPEGDYPGEDAVTESAGTACFGRFKRFVGIAYAKSELEPYFLFPTSRSWSLLDDRSITCRIGEPGTKTTGTLEGSRR